MSCITLISDFGLHDASVAVAKGVLMQHAPGVPVIDITHDVTPYHSGQAAYLLGTAWGSFPQGTVHVALFDIFSEGLPRLVLSEHRGHCFLSPDNGILPAALGAMPERSWLCFELTGRHTFTDWLHAAGSAVNEWFDGAHYDGAHHGKVAYKLTNRSTNQPINTSADELVCEAIHIDHYGNVVLGVTREQFEAVRRGRRFRIAFMQVEEITEMSAHYHDVREGFRLCRFNSNGYLEICINHGNAAGLLGLRLGSKHNDVKIFFE